MAMKRCPVCGEKYSDTYRYCPFCEEEEALKDERPLRRRSGKRSAPQRDPGILTPVLVIVILLLALTLGWLFFGDAIKEKLSGGAASSGSVSSQVEPSGSSSSGASSSGVSSSGAASSQDAGLIDGSVSEPDGGMGTGEMTVEQVAALPNTLTLSTADFTQSVGDAPIKLTAKGGSGTYTWYSEDDGIASVDENGSVTFISAGTINVYATDGTSMGLCVVRVKAGSGTPNTGATAAETTPSGGQVKLNREDFTLPVGETFQLTNTGITTAQTWSSSNPSVAKISNNGTVTAVAAGTATITMSYDGNSLSCIVRVK